MSTNNALHEVTENLQNISDQLNGAIGNVTFTNPVQIRRRFIFEIRGKRIEYEMNNGPAKASAKNWMLPLINEDSNGNTMRVYKLPGRNSGQETGDEIANIQFQKTHGKSLPSWFFWTFLFNLDGLLKMKTTFRPDGWRNGPNPRIDGWYHVDENAGIFCYS